MRWLPPVYSPLSAGAVTAGAAAALGLTSSADVAELVARRFDAGDVLLTDSGTGALTLAIAAALAERPGSAVALPAWACYDLATAADGANAPVLFYDLDPATLGPDTASLEAAVTQGASVVVVVHFYGMPVDLSALQPALPAGTLIIEDAAQGAGARVRGRLVGSLGELSVLSFGRGKGLTAGRGGALLARPGVAASLMTRARERMTTRGGGAARDVAALAAQWMLGRPALYGVPAQIPALKLGETVYHAPGPVGPLPAVSAAVLPGSLASADAETLVRQRNARRLLRAVRAPWLPMRETPDTDPGFLRLPLRQEGTGPVREARDLGVLRAYPAALPDLPGFTRARNRDQPWKGARELAARLVTAPVHSLLSQGDLERLEAWLGGVPATPAA